MRKAQINRKTAETDIALSLNLDGTGVAACVTGCGFLDHMLTLFAKHGRFDLSVTCTGDTYVDDHHTVEDIGICLGQAFSEALGDKRGIARYGSARVPMDETLCCVDLDFSGRSYLVYHCELKRDQIGAYSCEMTPEFLRAFAVQAEMTLHVNVLYGENDHHKVEAIFKAMGRAVRNAVCIVSDELPSTKGVI